MGDIGVELVEVDEARVGAPLRGKLRVRNEELLERVTPRVFVAMRGSRVEITGGDPFGGYRELACAVQSRDWEAGSHLVPFEVPVVLGPASYRGRKLVLAWSIVFELRHRSGQLLATAAFPIVVGRRDSSVATIENVGGYRDAPRYVADAFEPELGAEHVEGVRAPKPTWFSKKSSFDVQLEATPSRLAPGAIFGVTMFVFARARTPQFSADVALVHREAGSDHGGQFADVLTIAEATLTKEIDLPRGHSRFGARFAIPGDAASSYADPAVVTEWMLRAVARSERNAPVEVELVLTIP